MVALQSHFVWLLVFRFLLSTRTTTFILCKRTIITHSSLIAEGEEVEYLRIVFLDLAKCDRQEPQNTKICSVGCTYL